MPSRAFAVLFQVSGLYWGVEVDNSDPPHHPMRFMGCTRLHHNPQIQKETRPLKVKVSLTHPNHKVRVLLYLSPGQFEAGVYPAFCASS